MFNLENIVQYYPPILQNKTKHIIREYLQCEILDYIFSHKFANKLCFIWWTSLRLLYNNARFSEDLDFDNFDLKKEEFEDIMYGLQKYLQQNGYEVEIKIIYKWAYHCHIKIPKLLYENGIATMETEKILIKIDTYGQWYNFTPEKKQLKQFDFDFYCNVASSKLLLAHKINTLFDRYKWRDLFDISFLLGITKSPDLWYLEQKLGIKTIKEIKKNILKKVKEYDFEQLQKDVEPFLFRSNDTRVLHFKETIQQTEFEQ